MEEGWGRKHKHSIFNSILESSVLRFHLMDPDYLASYAMRTVCMRACGRSGEILQSAQLYKKSIVFKNKDDKLPPSRAPPLPPNHTTTSIYYHHNIYATKPNTHMKAECVVSRQALSSLEVGGSASFFVGLAKGVPVCLIWRRQRANGDEGKTMMGAYLSWSSGGLELATISGVEIISHIQMRSSIEVIHPTSKSYREDVPRAYKEDRGQGVANFFGIAWEDVLGEPGKYFNQRDEMKVIVTVFNP